MRVAFEDAAVHERARVASSALQTMMNFRPPSGVVPGLPLDPGEEARAPLPFKSGFLQFVDDLLLVRSFGVLAAAR